MKSADRAYLKEIDVAAPLTERIEELLSIAGSVIPSAIDRIFVSEFRAADETRQYAGLWFIGKTFFSEAPAFVTQNRFDCVPLARNIARYDVSSSNYDFKKTNKDSQLNVSFQLSSTINGQLYASGTNCRHLRDILAIYVAPHAVG